ncbi:MAG: ispG, partial [Acidobacteria bacterium]|nr:ispG [Acidobacteriota bacterium]
RDPDSAAIARFAGVLAGLAPGVMAGREWGGNSEPIGSFRLLAACLDRAGSRVPIVLGDRPTAPGEDRRVGVAGRLGSLLLDGIGDAVRLPAGPDAAATAKLLHDVLQAARRRLERADYIACPSCGRTLFELEETTERVRQLTSHLKLKIAVMGCVVNGPGEMADADFGYVGWGAGKVALFVGRELVERDVPSAEAPQKLVDLIRSRGRWTDPEPAP